MTRRTTPKILDTAHKEEDLSAMFGSATHLDIAAILIDAGTQPRARLDNDTVAGYAEAMRDGVRFPPVVVFHDGAAYYLADGFHRIAAAKTNGANHILADIRQGTVRDAILYSVGANAAHGLPRSNDDKRRAVLRLLEDTEWGAWSDSEIARRTATSQPFVSKLRGNLTYNVISEKPRQYVNKHGSQATMNTEHIGRPALAPQEVIVATLREWVKAWDEWNVPLEALLACDQVIFDDLNDYLPGKVSKDEIRTAAAALLADIRPARAEQPEQEPTIKEMVDDALIDGALQLWSVERFSIPAQRRQALTDLVRQGPQNTQYWNAIKARIDRNGVPSVTSSQVRSAASRLLAGDQPSSPAATPPNGNGAARPAQAVVTFGSPKATDLSLAELRNALLELFTLPASASNLEILQAASTAFTIARSAVNA